MGKSGKFKKKSAASKAAVSTPSTKKKLLIASICVGITAIIIIGACIFITYPRVMPEDKPEYTGVHDSKVYVDNKLDKKMSENTMMVLNYDGSGSLVVDGELLAEKWKPTDKGIKIGKYEMTLKNGSFVYEEDREGLKILFGSDIPEEEEASQEDGHNHHQE